jgi:hypothetical protein
MLRKKGHEIARTPSSKTEPASSSTTPRALRLNARSAWTKLKTSKTKQMR